ncbi:MAG: rod shape-determining protein RodA [Planctomycetales bacterium]|nr:rod shape-determining protein RodA [Planctomycetales bacterium]
MSALPSRLLDGLRSARRFAAPLVFGPPLVLAAVGLAAVASAAEKSGADGELVTQPYASRQLLWLLAAAVSAAVAATVPYRRLLRLAVPLWAISVLGLAAVLVLGTATNGSRRWMDLGPLRCQPSEIAKLAVVLAVAAALRRADRMRPVPMLARVAIVAGLPAALIVVEPDLGTALVVVPVAVAMLVAAGLPWRALAAAGALAAVVAIPAATFGLKDYQRARIRAFLGQGSYSEHQQVGEAYQAIQARIAVGSGGWTGRGYGEGTQTHLRFLPFPHTDFIFAVVAEEGGFLAGTAVLALFAALALGGLGAARRSRDGPGRLLAVGATTLLCVQAAVNLAMVVSLGPVTGLPLPFVSYGGSSLVASGAAVGLLLNVSARGEDADPLG